ncbi:transposase, IS4-like family protein [Leptospira weilii str. 2006001855]|nr:transposase, IS4-like family protein [Leptospira weilii str. 2006001855]EMN45362.1 transposase, IS4-like family protein [Leptospira weilii str. LNT 1234]
MKPQIISLDKAYSTNAIKSKLKKDKIKYRIPNKKNAKKSEKITP